MNFRTVIKCDKYDFKISYKDSMFFIGSCFSEEISHKLSHLKYKVLKNPAGVTFNPVSMARTIRTIFSKDSLPESSFNYFNELWSHPDFHSQFNNVDKTTFKVNIEESLSTARTALAQSPFIFITLGTAFVYESQKTGRVVNNCHKKPASEFNRRLLSIEEIKQALLESRALIAKYSEKNPQFILNLSPVRHIKDGLSQNQLSKSRCLCAIHELVNALDDVHYFPSYEILLDDLRDYRFYSRDLIHPSEEAVDYIFEKFEACFLLENEKTIRKEILAIQSNLNHKPFNPESEAYQLFISKTKERIERLKSEHGILF